MPMNTGPRGPYTTKSGDCTMTDPAHTTPLDVAIIGAGPAGLAAAYCIRDAGLNVALFDKGRGAGGRLSTRRGSDDVRLDHGCQFIDIDAAEDRSIMQPLLDDGSLVRWTPDGHELETSLPCGTPSWLIGTPTMNAVIKRLAEPFSISFDTRICELQRVDEHWMLIDAEQAHVATASIVLTAIPAPQAIDLLSPHNFAGLDQMRSANYTPLWSILCDAPEGVLDDFEYLVPNQGPLGWIANQAAKPGRSEASALVGLATREWSAQHVDAEHDWVRHQLGDALTTSVKPTSIGTIDVHRWRYALVDTPAGTPAITDERQGLIACGDWCLGSTVGHALDSGRAAGAAAAAQITRST